MLTDGYMPLVFNNILEDNIIIGFPSQIKSSKLNNENHYEIVSSAPKKRYLYTTTDNLFINYILKQFPEDNVTYKNNFVGLEEGGSLKQS